MSHPRPLLLLPLALLGLACAGLGKPEPEDTGNTPAVTVETDCGDDRDDDGDGATDCGDPDCVDLSPCNEADADADADADGDADADADSDVVRYDGTTEAETDALDTGDVQERCTGTFTLEMDWSTGLGNGTTECLYRDTPLLAGDVVVTASGSQLDGLLIGSVAGHDGEFPIAGVGNTAMVTIEIDIRAGHTRVSGTMEGTPP